MATVAHVTRPIPKWVSRLVDLRWYEWIGWLVEIGLAVTFIAVTISQFIEDEVRGGWVMIVLTVLICGPGAWLLLRYKPTAADKIETQDVALAIMFAIWAVIFIYLVGFMPQHEQGPFGSP